MKIAIIIINIILGVAFLIKWDINQPTGTLKFENFKQINELCANNNGIDSVNIRTEGKVYVQAVCNDGATFKRIYY